jgi:DNA repair protein RadC
MRIKDISLDNRPRERLQKHGTAVLSDAELLAIVLRSGTAQENVIDMSNRLISRHGLNKLSDLSLKELQEIKGIGPAKATQILALFELNRRCNISKLDKKQIESAKDIFDIFHEKLKDEKKEKFIAIHLDSKYNIIKEEVISIGTLDASIVQPREVFKGAIKESAHAIILVHNHPSGDPTPSKEDIEVTRQIMKASEVLDIELLDHIIIGENNYFSFKEQIKNM